MPALNAHIVMDGQNIAWAHGGRQRFSGEGLKLAISFFQDKGYKNVIAFVPYAYTQVICNC